MEFLEYKLLGNGIQQWLIACGVAAITFWSISLLTRFISEHLPKRNIFPPHTRGMLKKAIRINPLLILMVAISIASTTIKIPVAADRIMHQLLFLSVCLQCGLWASAIAWVFCAKEESNGIVLYRSSAHGLILIMLRMIIWIVLLLLVLENFGVNITALIAGLGIGGIAVALALQNILGDVLGSISIVLDKPFELGDFIVVGDTMGTVENIGIKTTRLRSLGGEQIVLPNSSLLTNKIQNFKRMYERRILFTFGVGHRTPVHDLREIPALVEKLIRESEKTRFDRAHFKEFGASALMFEAVYFVLTPDFNVFMNIQQEINFQLKEIFESKNISFASPTQNFYIQTDGRTETIMPAREA